MLFRSSIGDRGRESRGGHKRGSRENLLMRTLDTNRLQLRAWSGEDVDFAFDMYSRWEVHRFVGRVPKVMADRKEAEIAVARWGAIDHPTYGAWAVQHCQNGKLLGSVMLKPIPVSSDEFPLTDGGDIEIGWHLHPDAWGHGYATEAGTRVLEHTFDSGLAQVVAVVVAANTAARAVAARIGMTHQGPTARYYDTTCELFTAARPAP